MVSDVQIVRPDRKFWLRTNPQRIPANDGRQCARAESVLNALGRAVWANHLRAILAAPREMTTNRPKRAELMISMVQRSLKWIRENKPTEIVALQGIQDVELAQDLTDPLKRCLISTGRQRRLSILLPRRKRRGSSDKSTLLSKVRPSLPVCHSHSATRAGPTAHCLPVRY